MALLFNLLRNNLLFIRSILRDRALLLPLAGYDFRERFLGSHLGILWIFINPLITVFVFWLIFQVGFKTKPVNDFPYLLWLITGLFPWFYISESLLMGTQSVLEKPYLVKKSAFNVGLLPIVKNISAIGLHLFFVCLILIIFSAFGYYPRWQNLQVFYYIFAAFALVLGVSWLTSAMTVFMRDISQFVGIFIQFGFWLTPIMWSFNILPAQYHIFLKLNPAFYIIEGYRDAFIHGRWFWEKPDLTLYFWCVVLAFMFLGVTVFRRLRPQFADVL